MPFNFYREAGVCEIVFFLHGKYFKPERSKRASSFKKTAVILNMRTNIVVALVIRGDRQILLNMEYNGVEIIERAIVYEAAAFLSW